MNRLNDKEDEMFIYLSFHRGEKLKNQVQKKEKQVSERTSVWEEDQVQKQKSSSHRKKKLTIGKNQV